MRWRVSVLRWKASWALALLAGCATIDRTPGTPLCRHVALPVDVVAAVTAAAMRGALPFADPMAPLRAAPAQHGTDGGFVVCYERDAAGRWLPQGDCRLAVEAPEGVDAAVAVRCTASPAPGFGGGARQRVMAKVTPAADGALVTGELPRVVAEAIERALALAADPDAASPGLDEPNLAAFVGHRLWQRAAAAMAGGDDATGRALLQRAARLADAPAPLLGQLARLADDAGDLDAAAACGFVAVVTARDPRQRGTAGIMLLAPAAEHDHTPRERATSRLARGDLAGAERLLHTARRDDPWPAEDYRLLTLLHRQRQDDTAWATRLLAQEHALVNPPSTLAKALEAVRPALARHLPSFIHALPAAAPLR